jgi:hypothetical protein
VNLPKQRSVGEFWNDAGEMIARFVVEVACRKEEFGWEKSSSTVDGSTTLADFRPST